MPQRWKSILLSFFVASLFFTSCKKQFSSDTALPTNYYPSIIVNNDNQVVYAMDPNTGIKNWEFGIPIPSNYMLLNPTVPIVYTPSPVLYNEMVYMAYVQRDPGKTDTIFKLNAKTGALIKKITPNVNDLFNIQATPLADNGLLYVAGTNSKLYAIDTGTYAVKWTYSADGPIISSPSIYNGNLYFATTSGTVYCVDETLGPTATTNWSYHPSASVGASASPSFYSSPAIAAPYLYLGSATDSTMYCIYLVNTSGSATPPAASIERWRYLAQGGIYSSPAAYAGTCIFGCTDFRVYCLDTTINPSMGVTSPQARWIDSTHSSVYSSPYVYNQVVYIGSHDYNLYALNIINGGVKWFFASKGLIKSSPIGYNGMVFVGSYDKYMYGLDTSTGTVKWSQNTNGQIEDSPVIDDLTGHSYNSGISGYCNGGWATGFYTFNANNY